MNGSQAGNRSAGWLGTGVSHGDRMAGNGYNVALNFSFIAVFVVAARASKTRGNSGKIGGSFLVGPAPSITRRVGFSLDDDIERDAHGVYGFMCQSNALKGEVFQVGKCFDKSKKTDGCGLYYDKNGGLKWKFYASATSDSW